MVFELFYCVLLGIVCQNQFSDLLYLQWKQSYCEFSFGGLPHCAYCAQKMPMIGAIPLYVGQSLKRLSTTPHQ